MDQVLPFQRSINVAGLPVPPRLLKPAATQLVALGHETPSSSAPSPTSGFGLATTDSVVPFHRSTNVRGGKLAAFSPTAKQPSAARHATPKSSAKVEPARTVLRTYDQLLPFHRSTSVFAALVGPAC